MGAGGDGKARAGRKRDRDGNNGEAGKDGVTASILKGFILRI